MYDLIRGIVLVPALAAIAGTDAADADADADADDHAVYMMGLFVDNLEW